MANPDPAATPGATPDPAPAEAPGEVLFADHRARLTDLADAAVALVGVDAVPVRDVATLGMAAARAAQALVDDVIFPSTQDRRDRIDALLDAAFDVTRTTQKCAHGGTIDREDLEPSTGAIVSAASDLVAAIDASPGPDAGAPAPQRFEPLG